MGSGTGLEAVVELSRQVVLHAMRTIPRDIYERVADLAAGITNATLADDSALAEALYQRLLLYHEERLTDGRSHPFILETLGDCTEDPEQALR